jgi:MFS transporter, DHA2 family, methylenomycin A resistance protein
VWGQIAAIGGLALLAASMIEGGRQGWTNTIVLLGFATSIIFAVLFFFIEKKVHNPMLPLSLFSIRTFSATTAIGFLINISFYGLIFIISLYFQQIRAYSPLNTGLAFLPMMVAVLIANLSAGRLSKSIGPKRLMLLGEIIFLCGCVLLLSIGASTNFNKVAPRLAAMGLGVGLVVPPMTSSLLGSVDKSHSGIASGILNSMRQAGSVIGVALFGSIVSRHNQFLNSLHISLIISASLLLLSILFSLRISGKK